jgi:hypothetical protein
MASNHREIILNRMGKDPTRDEHSSGLGLGLTVNRVELVDGANPLRSWATRLAAWAPDGPHGRGKRVGRLSQCGVQRGFSPWPLREGKHFSKFSSIFIKIYSILNSNQI